MTRCDGIKDQPPKAAVDPALRSQVHLSGLALNPPSPERTRAGGGHKPPQAPAVWEPHRIRHTTSPKEQHTSAGIGPARCHEASNMYAVIRTGGKQYRVQPGDTLRIETAAHDNGAIEFGEVLAVSGEAGKFEQELAGAKVLGTVVGEGRGEKILVFKLKRKKQYKKMQGHRQNFVEVRINEIQINGQTFKHDAQ